MDEAFKTEWIKRLRSGDYVQGQGQLRSENKYCCLGVACDIAADWGMGEWVGDAFAYDDPYVSDGVWAESAWMTGHLPYALARRLGLPSGNPHMSDPNEYLSDLNDNGFGFGDIADIIQAQL